MEVARTQTIQWGVRAVVKCDSDEQTFALQHRRLDS